MKVVKSETLKKKEFTVTSMVLLILFKLGEKVFLDSQIIVFCSE